jgi:hypothetical protein
VIVGVEFFDAAGGPVNDASASSLEVAPASTVPFGTASSKASQQIFCGAFIAEQANNPVTVMLDLPLIRKTTQQGD